MGRTDVNLNLSQKLGQHWSTSVLLHDNFMYNKSMNFSHNGFRDVPVGNLFSGVNRWLYENGKGLMVQFGVKYLNDDRTGGQIDFNKKTDKALRIVMVLVLTSNVLKVLLKSAMYFRKTNTAVLACN
ncbi:hypothetical protein KUH03_12690 [Sphingobacterium sp. E70]|uniref:hypothetical protein n=1 Tax=Sphingobacterium sp. E70 TaxID=2853439 RepID=UPI00211C68DA|nr:hypothetical protein [Sphingobacterium sp. E70]ULT27507.1 hypothetical protein KUH03_12690 [Sphingobacterium sp. E70]